MLDYSGFEAKDIVEVARVVSFKVRKEAAMFCRFKLTVVTRKYEDDRYGNVSRVCRDPDVSFWYREQPNDSDVEESGMQRMKKAKGHTKKAPEQDSKPRKVFRQRKITEWFVKKKITKSDADE